MTPDSCTNFIRASTTDQTVLKTDSRVVRLFTNYDEDCDGKISLEEFLKFYQDACKNNPELVWSNLKTHQIGNDLKPILPYDCIEDPYEIKNPLLLPRFRLAQDQQVFDNLFELFPFLNSAGQSDLREFISALRINPLIFAKMLSLSGLSDLLQESNLEKILYSLEIFNVLLQEHSTLKEQKIKYYYYENQDYNNNFPALDSGSAAPQTQEPKTQQQDDHSFMGDARVKSSAGPASGSNDNDVIMETVKIHDGSTPIALPPASQGPVMVNQGGNIPDAPIMHNAPTYGPSLPPVQNQGAQGASQSVGVTSNNVKNKEMLEQFRGHIITETISEKVIPNEEVAFYLGITDLTLVDEMYASFAQSFIQNNGFKFLLQLMQKLIQIAKNQPDNEVFESRAHKECLQYIIKIMRTFLVSSFIANSEGSEMQIELRKQISSQAGTSQKEATTSVVESDAFFNDLENQIFGQESQSTTQTQIPFVNQKADSKNASKSQDEKKSKIQSDQENFENEYKPLIKSLRGELGQIVIQTVDFQVLQHEIFEALFLLFKKKILAYTDYDNAQLLISLWISIVLYNHSLIQSIMNDYYHHKQAQSAQSSLLDLMIMNGLLSSENKAKTAMEEALKFLFINLKVKPDEVNEPPYLFLLKVLINNAAITDGKAEHSRQYFLLLSSLFQSYFEAKKSEQRDPKFQEIFDTKEMLEEFIVKLQTYQPVESRKKQYTADYNQMGYIKIIEVILKNEPQIMDIDESRTLAHYLIEKCLFFSEIPPLDNHFLKGTDLESHEAPYLNKCKSFLCRDQAFSLLKVICINCPELITELMITHFSNILSLVSKPKRDNYSPKTEGRSFNKFCGIRNLGSICYMKSMIQQFFHIPAFRYCLMATEDNQPLNLQKFENRDVNDNMLHQLIKFMGFLELSERQDYDPRDFCFSFKDFAGQPTNIRIQQDTQEFLNLAFDRIERQLASTSQKYLLNNIFQGSTCSLMICKNCGNLRQNRDNFYNLSLEVKNQKNIYDALKKFVTGEIINDFQCEACNQRVDVERRSVIEKLPNMLMVHLQRIIFDFDTFQNVKLNTRLEFPNVLNMKPYMMSEIMKQEKELLKKAKKAQNKKNKINEQEALKKAQEAAKMHQKEDGKEEFGEEIQEQDQNQSPSKQMAVDDESSEDEDMDIDSGEQNEDLPDEEFEYKLVGVVVHMGTAQAGHYVSYINIQRGHKDEATAEWLETDKDNWLEFNDSHVKMYTFRSMEEDCFGGQAQGFGQIGGDMKSDYDYTKNAYMLIYEKRRKQQIKIVVPEEIVRIVRSLGCDGTAISRAVEQINSIDNYFLQVVPSARDLLLRQDGIQFDEQAQEHYILVDFNSAQQFVPHKIYKHVHDDNQLFLREKYIINNDFFSFIKVMFEQLIEKSPFVFFNESPTNKCLFDMLQKLLFELLPFTSENSHYKAIYQLFLQALSLNREVMSEFISTRILVDKSKLEKDERTFIENMIQNIDSEKRETNKNTLLFIVNELFEQDQIDKVDEIIQPILAMIPDEFSKNWLKIGQTLSLIFELIKKGAKQFNYFVKNGIVTKFIDLFMEQDSPKNVNKTRQPMGSSYASPQLENVILTLSWIVRHYPSINLKGEENLNQRNADSIRPNACSVLFMTEYGQNVELEPLSEEDIFMLNQKAFYTRNLKAGFERLEFARMIAHLNFLNYEFSRKSCKIILMGINKIINDDPDALLQALRMVLQIQDIFCYIRCAWILGVPSLKINVGSVYRNGQNMYVTKMGVSLMDNPTDDVFEYKSPLFKSQQTVRDSLLQLLYTQRRRYSKLVLRALFQLLLAAECNMCFKYYLQVLEAPCYIYGRYIDWMLPFFQDQLNYVKGSNQQQQLDRLFLENLIDKFNYLFAGAQNQSKVNFLPKQEEEMKEEASEQINTSTNQSQNQDQPQPNNQSNSQINKKFTPYEYGSFDGGPEQFMIWNLVSENVVSEQVYEDHVKLTVKELTVRVSESKPDGRYNQVFSPNQFNRYANNNNNRNNNYNEDEKQDRYLSSGKKTRARNFGRGQAINLHQESGTYQTQIETSKFKVQKPTRHREDNTHHNYNQDDSNPYEQSANEQYISEQDGADLRFDQANPNEDGAVRIGYENDYGDQQNYQDNEFEQNAQDNDERRGQDNSMEVEFTNDNQQDQIDVQQDYAYQKVQQDPQESILRDLDVQEYNDQTMRSGVNGGQMSVSVSETGQGIVPAHQGNNQRQDQQDVIQQDERYGNNQQSDDLERGQVHGYAYDSYNQSNINQQQEPQNKHMNDQQMDQEPQNDQPDFWEADLQCVLVFTVQNLDQINPVNVQLSINENAPFDNQQENRLNFKRPFSPISGLLLGGRVKDILILTKLRPFENWGQYESVFEIKKPKEKQGAFNQFNDNNQVILPLNDINAANNQQIGMEDINTNFLEDDLNGEIACPACTFLNSSFLSNCDVCGGNLK